MAVPGVFRSVKNIHKSISKYTLPHYIFSKSVKEEACFAPSCMEWSSYVHM